MRDHQEIGLALATALALDYTPDPMPLTFGGQNDVSERAQIVLAVLDECEDAGVELARVELSPELYAEVRQWTDGGPVTSNPNLHGEARFYRSKRGGVAKNGIDGL